jgi:hypothetical protein
VRTGRNPAASNIGRTRPWTLEQVDEVEPALGVTATTSII